MKNIFLTISILLISICAVSQIKSNYAKGFEVGFKEGYCYNNKNVSCFYPLTPIAPLPRINENKDNYTDGYNRGFQFGLDLKRANQAVENTDIELENERIRFNDYISQAPLIQARTRVGMYKQKMYDTRKDWIQQKIYKLIDLINVIYSEQNMPPGVNVSISQNNYRNVITKYVNSIAAVDFADDYQFGIIQNKFSEIENSFYSQYNEHWRLFEKLSDREKIPVAESSNQSENNENKVASNSQRAITYFQKAKEEWNNKNPQSALENINNSIEMDPNNPYSYEFRGWIYHYGIRNYDKAVEDFTKEIQMQPDNSKAYFSRGMAFHDLDKNMEALKDFTKCINLDNDNTNAYFLRGLIKSGFNDRNGAISDYDEIIKREKTAKPENYKMGTVYNNKGYCLIELDKLDEALPYINKALEMEPYESYVWSSRGELYYKKGDYKSCIKDMTKAIEVSNKTEAGDSDTAGWPYYLRGLAKIKLGQKQDGCKDLSKAGELGTSEAYKAISENCK